MGKNETKKEYIRNTTTAFHLTTNAKTNHPRKILLDEETDEEEPNEGFFFQNPYHVLSLTGVPFARERQQLFDKA